jgi:hypothetical protein
LPIAKLASRMFGSLIVRISWHVPFKLLEFDFRDMLKFSTEILAQNRNDLLRISIATSNDIELLHEAGGEGAGSARKRIDAGDIGFIARDTGGQIAGYKWLSIVSNPASKRFEEESTYHFKLLPKSAWTFDAFVKPSCRRMGVWRSLSAAETQYALEHGIKNIYCFVRSENDTSLKAHLSFGYRKLRTYFYMRIWKYKIIISDNNNPFD